MKYTQKFGNNYYTFDVNGNDGFKNWKHDIKIIFKVMFYISIGLGLIAFITSF